ncbi:MAG: hypothetical protein CXT77_01485 [uncultured DHVE6 group euryarchaeote]|jgi:PmbA protein|nr:MAG: hypothetical protein CXT77_01485 [uncultured DHVE6 group euryarchaeote]
MSLHEAQDYIHSKLSKFSGDFVLISEQGKDSMFNFKDTKVNLKTSSKNMLTAAYSKGQKVKIVEFDLKKDLDSQIKLLTTRLRNDPNFKGFSTNSKYRLNEIHDKNLANFNVNNILDDAIDLAFQHGAKKIGGKFNYQLSNVRLLNSNGIDYDYDSSKLSMGMRVFVNDNSASKVISSTTLKDFDYRKKVIETLALAKEAVFPEKIKPGKYSIILDPLAFSYVINELGDSKFASKKMGKSVGSKHLTLYDVGNLRGGLGSAPFDKYGHPTRATEIISSGVLKNVSHDPNNFVVPIGKRSRQKLISEVNNGLLITNFSGAKLDGGKISLSSKDAIFLIKDGQIIGSGKPVKISEKLEKFMDGFTESSNSKERLFNPAVSTPVELPTAIIEGLKIR